MRVLVIGGGGREHALVWKLRQSAAVEKIFCAPGNAGIAELAELVAIEADDIAGLVDFAEREKIDLTVPGPELALTLGIVDELEARNLRAFGPSKSAARLEGSKVFTKRLMQDCQVPTGFFASFSDAAEARRYLREVGAPVVVKADGLAAGKGVVVCSAIEEADRAIEQILEKRVFGEAGDIVLIEEFLDGEEASFMAVSDGETVLPLASSQDHKRIFDGDRGPNTGGMGAYSPAPVVTEEIHRRVMEEVVRPLVRGLAERGIRYRGILYAGLMITANGPKVLEFNVRFGDPECQAILMRLRGDLLELMNATVDGRLGEIEPQWDSRAAACVVLAAEGYPGAYEKGRVIRGLKELAEWRDGTVFHAGTAVRDGAVVTSGGRVLGVTALGADIGAAVNEAYRGVSQLGWSGMQYRKDIGHRALKRGGNGKA